MNKGLMNPNSRIRKRAREMMGDKWWLVDEILSEWPTKRRPKKGTLQHALRLWPVDTRDNKQLGYVRKEYRWKEGES